MTAISSKSLGEGNNNSGNGPVLRRRVIRRRVKRTDSKNSSKQQRFNWLSVITCLITMEAVALVRLVFRNDSIFDRASSSFSASSGNGIRDDPSPLDLLVWLDTTLGGGRDEDRDELTELEAHLVQRTEDRLDHVGTLEREVEITALDDYYSRTRLDSSTPSVLIVGGIEGSGSMAVVDALLQLKVPMISLDQSATPAEASMRAMQTIWQNLVQIVLDTGMQSVNYEFSSLPVSTQAAAKKEWQKLVQHFPTQSASSSPGGGIRYGFFAPDTFFMLPVLHALMGHPIKFLHLLRDGRDLSLLSGKETPRSSQRLLATKTLHSSAEQHVLDNYDMDPDLEGGSNQRIVKAMRLWNDWNRDSHQWQQQAHQNADFEYLAVRAEDYLSPETKLESLIQLSDFVNADVTIETLCCLSRQAMIAQSADYLKNFAKAQAQKDGSDQISLLHQQDEDDRRKARLGDLMRSKFKRRRHAPPGGLDNDAAELDQHRQDRFQKIGERIAARISANGENGASSGDREMGTRRRLSELQIRRRRLDFEETNDYSAAKLLRDYGAWRKTFPKAMNDEDLAKVAVATGEKLLAQYRANEQDFEGILTEQSFTRSIKWLKNIHHNGNDTSQAGHKTKRYGKWVQLLDDQPVLAQRLQTIGKESLQIFGYEPSARFLDFDPQNRKAQCHVGITCSN